MLFLLGNDKVVLALGKLFLIVLWGFFLIFRLERFLLRLRLLINSVVGLFVVVVTRAATIVPTIATSIPTTRESAATTTVATTIESFLLVVSAIFAGSVDCVKIVVGIGLKIGSLITS